MLGKGHGSPYKGPTIKEGERLRERDKIKFIDLRFERWQVGNSGKQEESKTFHRLHVLGMNDDLWDRVRGLASETWKVFELQCQSVTHSSGLPHFFFCFARVRTINQSRAYCIAVFMHVWCHVEPVNCL